MRILLILLTLFVSGCGYHVPGASDSWVGGDARLVYVQLFENMTAEPYLDNYMTDALVEELSRSRLFELTENLEAAEVLIGGTVDSFTSNAISYSSTDRITDYRATMAITVRLLDNANDKIMWREKMRRSEDYSAAVNKNLQLEGQRLTARQVAKRLAEDIRSQLLNNF
jgi:outer membrane lipopolysaccharide assembly protein LptE/RlpB